MNADVRSVHEVGMNRRSCHCSLQVAFLPIAVTLLLGCSGTSGSFSSMEHDSGTATGADADPLMHADGTAPVDGGSNGDSAPDDASHCVDSATSDAGKSLLTPSPPPGATECGSGDITQASVTTACMMPNTILDSMPLPDGGTTMTPRACDAITVASGMWQVWCTPTEAYIWARFDGVKDTGTLHDCHGLSLLEIDEGVYSSGFGGGNGTQVATFELDGTEIGGLTSSMTENMVFAATIGNPSSTGGAADIFVLGSLEDSCGGGGLDQETVLAGATVAWK
jgi:hypothetical protein